jgi:protein SCO1/2
VKRCSVISLVALLASAAAIASPAPERTLLAEPPRAIADVQLTDQSGKAVKLADFRGAPVLMFFGFTHCSSVCPAALHQLRQLERQHGVGQDANRDRQRRR